VKKEEMRNKADEVAMFAGSGRHGGGAGRKGGGSMRARGGGADGSGSGGDDGRCWTCSEVGHIAFYCERNVDRIKCTACRNLGHVEVECRRGLPTNGRGYGGGRSDAHEDSTACGGELKTESE
jgi:hypothetical protein